ncbi:unnamed protein product [Lampetra fluviatilis]
MIYDILQQWGARRDEVKFYLRHDDPPTVDRDPGECPAVATGANTDQRGNRPTQHGGGGGGSPSSSSGLSKAVPPPYLVRLQEQRVQHMRQQQGQQAGLGEAEKLQRLRERVESQEAKIRKIRAMRGQVDQPKLLNNNLLSELTVMNSFLTEKQRELSVAVTRVEELTQQLEDLRKGKSNGFCHANLGKQLASAVLDLDRLYRELQTRNRLQQEQNQRQQHRRNGATAEMERRINELREQMLKKKLGTGGTDSIAPSPERSRIPNAVSGRVAAVGPFITNLGPPDGTTAFRTPGSEAYGLPTTAAREASPALSTGSSSSSSSLQQPYHPPMQPPSSALFAQSKSGVSSPYLQQQQGVGSSIPYTQSQVYPPSLVSGGSGPRPQYQLGSGSPLSQQQASSSCGSTSGGGSSGGGSYPQAGEARSYLQPGPQGITSGSPRPSLQSGGSGSSGPYLEGRADVAPPPGVLVAAARPSPSPTDSLQRSQSPRKQAPPPTLDSSSIYSMYTQHAGPSRQLQHAMLSALGKNQGRQLPGAAPAGYGKPTGSIQKPPVKPLPAYDPARPPYSPPLPYGLPIPRTLQEDRELEMEGLTSSIGPASGTDADPPRPLSPTKLMPISMSPLRGQSDADLEALRRKLQHAPRPLKKRGSIAEPETSGTGFGGSLGGLGGGGGGGGGGGVGGGVAASLLHHQTSPGHLLQKLQYQRLTLSVLEEGAARDFGQIAPPLPTVAATTPSSTEEEQADGTSSQGEEEPNNNDSAEEDVTTPSDIGAEDSIEDHLTLPSHYLFEDPEQEFDPEDLKPPIVFPPTLPPNKRTNLKKPGSERTGTGDRVKFNPLALLLDASLEGEFDLVQRVIYEAEDPSRPNDEGITALHNAVCAGHMNIVRFLVQFGVNVNAGDSDGWTPLHCAASCNSTQLCRFLVETGAAVFAATQSDMETAAEKCDEMEEGYEQCYQFLYGVQEKMGVMNKGVVYALWDLEAESEDELTVREGDALTALRRGDDEETEWWWVRLDEREGYVPRNLLGLYPRIKPRQRSLA